MEYWNDGGLFCKYVMTDVLPELTKQDLQAHPKSAMPDFVAHKPTMDKIDFFGSPDTPIHATLQKLTEDLNTKKQKEGLSTTDYLRRLSTQYSAELAIWMKTMEGMGWKFPENGAPVPPPTKK